MEESVIQSWVEDGKLHKTAFRIVPLEPEVAWQVMIDHEGYADVAYNLSKVEVVSGRGLGMCRRCYDTSGRGWGETCTLWEEGRAYAFSVDTHARLSVSSNGTHRRVARRAGRRGI